MCEVDKGSGAAPRRPAHGASCPQYLILWYYLQPPRKLCQRPLGTFTTRADRSAPTTAITHIAIQEALNGKAVKWMERVTNEQYLAGPTNDKDPS